MGLTPQLGAPWYRVFYRTGRDEALQGEDQLARALARKVPAVIHHELAILHSCWACGTEGPWNHEWLCLPIYGQRWHALQATDRREAAAEIYCSLRCWHEATGGYELPTWIDLHAEPRDVERSRALLEARYSEKDRARSTTAHRSVPMPKWKGRGWCKWCSAIIMRKDKPGKQDFRRNWHRGCLDEYELHALLERQVSFVARRDGRGCAVPGCPEDLDQHPGLQLDHRVPLWSVRDLPDDERRWYYGPGNLWLLCVRHHAQKTAREARERAVERRFALAQLRLL